jgi:hypothetical protein
LNRHNPYDPETRLKIQQAIYGRPALPDENQHGYAYPAYAPLVILPFLPLPFPISASVWIAGQQILVVAAVALTIRATRWQIERWRTILLCLAAMAFRYSMITFVLGQTSIWVLCCLTLALWASMQRRDILAGLALAAGSIKPQLMILPALVLLMSLAPRQRKRTFLALSAAMTLLIGCSWLFAGPWFGDYVQQLQAYQQYSTTEFPLTALAENWLPHSSSQLLNAFVVALLLGMLSIVSWRWRGSGQAALPMGLAIVMTQLVVPQTGSYNLVLLLLPIIVILYYVNTRQCRTRWLGLAGRLLVWTDLLLIPWLLWPVVQHSENMPLDKIVVPALLLAVMPAGFPPRNKRILGEGDP